MGGCIYWKGSSHEHFPPKCIFPTIKLNIQNRLLAGMRFVGQLCSGFQKRFTNTFTNELISFKIHYRRTFA